MELSKLIEIKKELKRFEERLNSAIKKVNEDGYIMFKEKNVYKSTEVGALKRAALDLKQCLTRKLC